MPYTGIQSQIRKNNLSSMALLIAFPLLLLAMVYAFLYFTTEYPEQEANESFVSLVPYVLLFTAIWFVLAWLFHSSIIRMATGAVPLERKENMRVYNLLENLCISQGIQMPKLYVINDSSLNAFASGLTQKAFSITLSTGLIDRLNDEELEAVMAHELSHIQNKDVRLLIISIIFVGIFSFIAEMAFRSLRFAGGGKKGGKNSGMIILVAVVVSAICYFISMLMRFGISRSREFMADAGSAEMTKNPRALASALRKISKDPAIEAVESRDVAQLFIDNPKPSAHGFSWDNLFATHPPMEKRIELLEQYT